MKRLIIICEGETEQQFCNNVLYNHFIAKNIQIQTPIIKKTKGGIVPWESLKIQIKNHLQEKDAFVSTFIDYYGLPNDYPNFADSNVDKIIEGMKNEINNSRFIPYIQQYEFECFVFCNLDIVRKYFDGSEKEFKELENAVNTFANPEEINNSKQTAPSKRLQKNFKRYNKILHGIYICSEIGLAKIREKCPRFNKHIENLEKL